MRHPLDYAKVVLYSDVNGWPFRFHFDECGKLVKPPSSLRGFPRN